MTKQTFEEQMSRKIRAAVAPKAFHWTYPSDSIATAIDIAKQADAVIAKQADEIRELDFRCIGLIRAAQKPDPRRDFVKESNEIFAAKDKKIAELRAENRMLKTELDNSRDYLSNALDNWWG